MYYKLSGRAESKPMFKTIKNKRLLGSTSSSSAQVARSYITYFYNRPTVFQMLNNATHV